MDRWFGEAYRITLGYEGGVSNNMFDPGGFTYYGIARNRWPDWKGWRIVDADIKRLGRPRSLDQCPELATMVKDFYYFNFWRTNNLDKIAFLSPNIAIEVFDAAVNGGGARLLQRTLNLMNRRGTLWQDIAVDGSIGPFTLQALEECLKKRGEERTYRILNYMQGGRYIELMEGNPDRFEEFIGWFERVETELPVKKNE